MLDLLFITFGLAIAGIVKGATGLGYASIALPFLVMTVGLKPAMGLVLVPALATNINLALTTGHLEEVVRRFAPLYLMMLPGIGLGLWLLSVVDPSVAVRVLGLVILSYTAFALAKPSLRIRDSHQGLLQWPTGLLNGVVTGLTGAQVMPLFPYILALQMDSARTVQAINLAVLVASTFLAVGLVSAGFVPTSILAWSALATIPALAGVHVGARLRRALPEESFRRIALATLMLIGLLLIMR